MKQHAINRRFFALLFSLAFVLLALPSMAFAASNGDTTEEVGTHVASVTVSGNTTYYTDLQVAISAANGGTVTLLQDVTTTENLPFSSGEITLDLNNHGITAQQEDGDNFSVITVNTSANLTLTDSTPTEDMTTRYGYWNENGTYTIVAAEPDASTDYTTFTGGYITGGTGTKYLGAYRGGGVYVTGSSASFTMAGGNIVGNSVTSDSENGGGVAVTSSGTFAMTGGTITDNKASNNGGGVHVSSGTITISGGTITGNASVNGGGVYVDKTAFTMEGGKISGNTASSLGGGVYVTGITFAMTSGEISGNNATDGGGVYVPSTASMTLGANSTAGTITGNTASRYGGGVYIGGSSTSTNSLTMGGSAVISKNKASYGGGVYVSKTTFTMGGTAVISDNEATGTSTGTGNGNGGGVCVAGGSTSDSSTIKGSITLSDTATISGNTASYGGGVYSNGVSVCTINGGTITGNVASSGGGGVYVTGADTTFAMTSGEISDNEASSGGGVYLSGASTITGGKITDNTASATGGGICLANSAVDCTISGDTEISDNTASTNGGGVYLSGGTLTITGGTISGNNATNDGGGVYVDSGDTVFLYLGVDTDTTVADYNSKITITDNTKNETSANNLYLTSQTITLQSALATGSEIGITLNTAPTATSGIAISTAGEKATGVFFADNTAYHVNESESSGEYTYTLIKAVASVTVGSGDDASTNYFDTIEAAVTAANAATTDKDSPATIILLANVTTTATLPISSGYITLDLNNHVIDASESTVNISVITVSADANLALKDSSTTQTTRYGYWNEDGTYTIVAAEPDAGTDYTTFTGGYITGGTGSNYGAGVYVNGGTFNMVGGTIAGNKATYGGGVYIRDSGSFTMSGGTIAGNSASSYNGGGVWIAGSTFKMEGGTITGNTASGYGGGVYMNGSTSFTMTGGTISGNTAKDGGGVSISSSCTFTMGPSADGDSPTISGNTASTSGGGVYIAAGTFTMNGGAISGNTADTYGGGVYVDSGLNKGTFQLYGGSITGNRVAVSYGGGVFVGSGKSSGDAGIFILGDGTDQTITITGNTRGSSASTTNNVYLAQSDEYADATISINDAISSTSSIGITTKTAPTATSGVAISTAGKKATGVFFADNTAYHVNESESSGEYTYTLITAVASVTVGSDDDASTNYFETIEAAVTAATTGVDSPATIILLANVTTTATLPISSGDITLDLNGYTIDANQGEFYVITVSDGANLTLTDSGTSGSVTGGDATNGGGVYVDGTFSLSGAPTVQSVSLASGKSITLTGAYTGTKIPVTIADTPLANAPVTVVKAGGSYEVTDTDAAKFSYTGTTGDMLLLHDEIQVVVWTYSTENETGTYTITATSDTSVPSKAGDGGSITLAAPTELTYTGSAIEAVVTKDGTVGWLAGTYSVVYSDGTNTLESAPVNVGSYTATITLGGESISDSYTITSATVSIADVATTKITYGDTLADSTISGTVTFGTDTVAGTFVWGEETTVPQVSDSGTTVYSWTFTPESSNYATATGRATVTVAAKAITITAADQTITYGDSIATGTSKVSITSGSLVTGDTLSGITLTASSDNVAVQDKTIAPSGATISGASNGASNYAITYGNGSLTINAYTLTVSWANWVDDSTVYTYHGATQSYATALTVAGVGNETVYLSVAIAGDFKDAGDYTATASLPSSYSNYTLSTTGATTSVTIAKATAPTITYPTASDVIYGNTLASSSLSGGSISYGTFAWADDSVVPTVSNDGYSVVFTPSEATLKNYDIAASLTATVAITVSAASITDETAASQSTTYTGNAQSPSLGTITTANSQAYTVAYSTVSSDAYTLDAMPSFTNAGTYTVYYKITAANHQDVEGSIAFEITKAAAPSITYPAASDVTYGDTLASSSLSGGSISYGTFAWADDSVVPTVNHDGYSVVFTPSEATLSNYDIAASLTGTIDLTVQALAYDATSFAVANIDTQTYTGVAITPAPALTVQLGGETVTLVLGEDYTLSYANNIDAATSTSADAPTVIVAFVGNYSGSTSMAFTIEKAIVSLYQGETKVATGVLIDGVVVFDAVDGTTYTPEEGTYNLVVSFDGVSQTEIVTVSDPDADVTASAPVGDLNTSVTVVGDIAAAVGGLSAEMLTDDGKNALENGDQVYLGLSIDEKEKTEVAADAVRIDGKLSSDALVGLYLDITLTQTIYSDNAATHVTITELENGLVQIVIPLPEALQGMGSYTVYRVHTLDDGSTEVHEITTTVNNGEYITLNSDKTVLTMYVNQFSTYAITYTQPEEESEPEEDTTPDVTVTVTPSTSTTTTYDVTSPETGDTTPVLLWALLPLVLLAGGMLCGMTKHKKQRRYK